MEPKRIILRDVNRCIYCHTTEGKLTQEHIVPFGLNGEHILLHASCARCAEITSKIELSVLRYTFIAARSRLNLKSRHKKAWEDPGDAFTTIIFPVTEAPAHLTGGPYAGGVNVKGLVLAPIGGQKSGQTPTTFHGNNFERMLAKIALGFAIGQFGIEAFEEFYVLKGILGEVDDIGRWVGTADNRILDFKGLMYTTHLQNINNEIICRIKLFAMFHPPEYLVVVGKLKDAETGDKNQAQVFNS